jgi:hypothetical protein
MGNRPADIAKPDDAKAPTGYLVGQGTLAGWPLRLAQKAIGGGDSAQQADDQPDGEVGDIIGQNAGRGGDADAPALALHQVDLVETDTIDCDDTERRESRHHRRRDTQVPACHDGADVAVLPQYLFLFGLLELGPSMHAKSGMQLIIQECGEWAHL